MILFQEILRTCRNFTPARAFVDFLIKPRLERFYLVFGGHVFFETLYVAAEYDLFTLLDERKGLTLSEIVRELSIEEQPCRILLLGLVASGIIRKQRDVYKNSAVSRILLSRRSERSVLSYVRLQHHLYYKPLHHFLESVKEYRNAGLDELEGDEPTVYERIAHNPELEKMFHQAMDELSVQSNEVFARAVDFCRFSYLIDVGGGDATNIITLANRFPDLRASVFDFPSVCESARQNIKKHKLEERLSVIEGNAFLDSFPQGADCFVFCHFFTIWSKMENLELLKKAYEVLPSGGQAMIFNMMQHDDETGPLTAALGSPYFLALATGRGMLYTWKEYESLFREAGFQGVRRLALPFDHGVIMGTKP